jgi:DNA-binding XRE family transcriptional regulator
MKNHPNSKLTEEDVEQIRQIMDWKKEEIARINSIASHEALAKKFDVSKRTIENIGNYVSHRIKSPDLVYNPKKTDEQRKNISVAKLSKDRTAAGEYTRRTGIPAIDVIREMALYSTKTEVASFFGWRDATCVTSWLSLRGYEVEFKKHKPIPPKRNGWGAIDLSRKPRESKSHAAQNTL